jgi:hypothetical protein
MTGRVRLVAAVFAAVGIPHAIPHANAQTTAPEVGSVFRDCADCPEMERGGLGTSANGQFRIFCKGEQSAGVALWRWRTTSWRSEGSPPQDSNMLGQVGDDLVTKLLDQIESREHITRRYRIVRDDEISEANC